MIHLIVFLTLYNINKLVTSTPDGPTIHTNSKTHNPTNITQLTDVPTTDMVNAPPPLMEDQKDTLG